MLKLHHLLRKTHSSKVTKKVKITLNNVELFQFPQIPTIATHTTGHRDERHRSSLTGQITTISDSMPL